MTRRTRTGFACLGLFALNAIVVWRLFGVEYLDQFDSVEGIFCTFGRFLRESWPHIGWFPWFDAGMPIENAYLPLVPWLVAAISFLGRCSPAHAFHFLAAITYALGPVFLFLFARRLAGHDAPALIGAAAWSLFSPSVVFPALLHDMATAWGSRRLVNVVTWGETPHNISVSLIPLALLLIARFLDAPGARRFALATVAVAVVLLSNTFGIVVLVICAYIFVASRDDFGFKSLLRVTATIVAAWLLICRFLEPSLLRLIGTSAQSIGGDFRFTLRVRLIAFAFAGTLVVLWLVLRRVSAEPIRFPALYAACFSGVLAMIYLLDIGFLPQPTRYHLEMDQAVCLLAGFALYSAMRRLPRRILIVCAGLGVLALAWLAVKNCELAERRIRPIDVTKSMPWREARWIAEHLPGQRVLVSGENEYWFNLFADNPQLSAGHDPSAPNWMQRVAVYIIYSGQAATAERDGPLSVFWLKAFGVSAITVPGAGSPDPYRPILRPEKFEGLLPLIWRDGYESIYRVPLRSTSLAHVIPTSAIVRRQPRHGLDVGPMLAYVAALDDPSLPLASVTWSNPERGRISTTVAPGQVILLQVNYDPGWKASIAGRPLRVTRDKLGLIVIEPDRAGRCDIDIAFGGGTERTICLILSLATLAALAGMLSWRTKVWRQ
ncbi:MAG TPA: hypothetical protein VMJ34_05710 [Bryobacteraceae bacterium]|nr:hypothetical protein [Bryobacteraceae bacterium]